jgi:hypothetical protein
MIVIRDIAPDIALALIVIAVPLLIAYLILRGPRGNDDDEM